MTKKAMIVEGEEIPEIVVEQFMLEVTLQSGPFRAGNLLPLATAMHVFDGDFTPHRFIDRILQKLRRAKKIRFSGGYWSVVSR